MAQQGQQQPYDFAAYFQNYAASGYNAADLTQRANSQGANNGPLSRTSERDRNALAKALTRGVPVAIAWVAHGQPVVRANHQMHLAQNETVIIQNPANHINVPNWTIADLDEIKLVFAYNGFDTRTFIAHLRVIEANQDTLNRDMQVLCMIALMRGVNSTKILTETNDVAEKHGQRKFAHFVAKYTIVQNVRDKDDKSKAVTLSRILASHAHLACHLLNAGAVPPFEQVLNIPLWMQTVVAPTFFGLDANDALLNQYMGWAMHFDLKINPGVAQQINHQARMGNIKKFALIAKAQGLAFYGQQLVDALRNGWQVNSAAGQAVFVPPQAQAVNPQLLAQAVALLQAGQAPPAQGGN